MDEIEKRLRDTSDHCFSCYEAWRKDQKNASARESLQEAIHELRKVASRLEIELAISERDQMKQKPIPIPEHRDGSRRAQGADDDIGNREQPPPSGGGPEVTKRPSRARRSSPRKPSDNGNNS